MIKIFVEKGETIGSIIEKTLSARDSTIVIVIPKHADFAKVAGSFDRLKRDVDGSAKNVLIESVDDEVLAQAQAAGLAAMHSFFKKDEFHRSFSDIVPEADLPVRKGVKKPSRRKSGDETEYPVPVSYDRTAEDEEDESESYQAPPIVSPRDFEGQGAVSVSKEPPALWMRGLPRQPIQDGVPDLGDTRPQRRGKKIFWIAGVITVVLVLGIAWIASTVFNTADVALTFAKTPWEYNGTFAVDTAVAEPNGETRVLPGELFRQSKNVVMLFPASGKKNVSEKARGTITIVNAYSSQSQQLVATTRFMAPDGKIFRLEKAVTVPGASVKDGKITPSTVDAPVIADQAGVAYNVGTVEKLTIPGFKGTPRYDGFYGTLKGASGGFVGERAYPTDADIAGGKTKVTEALKSGTQLSIENELPNGFVIPDGATSFSVTKLTVDPATDAEGKFKVFGEAQLKGIGFREADARSMLLAFLQNERSGETFKKNPEVSFASTTADFTKGRVSFSLSVRAQSTPIFNPEAFQERILGKTLAEVREELLQFSGLTDAKVSFWPIWVKRVPGEVSRVKVTIID